MRAVRATAHWPRHPTGVIPGFMPGTHRAAFREVAGTSPAERECVTLGQRLCTPRPKSRDAS
jgi:hypothetical protein